ncbi:MAG TPA: hypothetical protein VHM69_19390 [Rubrobacter sp.]|nr:hypothetical protein [Rubrobacter sp.]
MTDILITERSKYVTNESHHESARRTHGSQGTRRDTGGVVHQPSNPGTEPTRVLLIFSPAGMDRFFEEAAEGRMPLQAVPTDPEVKERLDSFTSRYGYEFAEFPQ